MIDTNLTGVFHTVRASIPHVKAARRGGSIILTSSTAGLVPHPNVGHYVSAKHGVVGLMRTLALELAPDMIRVNSLHPTQVDTPMIMNDATGTLFTPKDPSDHAFAAVSEEDERAADPLVGARRRLQRTAVPRLRRGSLHHGRGAPIDAGAVIK